MPTPKNKSKSKFKTVHKRTKKTAMRDDRGDVVINITLYNQEKSSVHTTGNIARSIRVGNAKVSEILEELRGFFGE